MTNEGEPSIGWPFGPLLRAYREQVELSQRRLASVLRVDESTIARIEAGTKRPPRDLLFYQRFLEVPGLSREDLKNLLSAEDALGPIMDLFGEKRRPTFLPAHLDVEGVWVNFRIDGTGAHLSREEERALGEILKQEISLGVRAFIRRRA